MFAVIHATFVTLECATSSDMADLVKEMEIMKTIGKHTNLRGLLGCCSQDGERFLLELIAETAVQFLMGSVFSLNVLYSVLTMYQEGIKGGLMGAGIFVKSDEFLAQIF